MLYGPDSRHVKRICSGLQMKRKLGTYILILFAKADQDLTEM